MKKYGSDIPFMRISHDIWDSKLYAMLGVSIFFIHPVTADRIVLPVGLVRSQGKTGRIIADQTFSILSRFGITNKDVYSCVSDNASSALLASKLLSSNKLKKPWWIEVFDARCRLNVGAWYREDEADEK